MSPLKIHVVAVASIINNETMLALYQLKPVTIANTKALDFLIQHRRQLVNQYITLLN